MDTFLVFNTDGMAYAESNTAGPVSTTTTVSATPDPVQVGDTVTLTATVTVVSGAAVSAGTVQFGIGGSVPSNVIGSPVAVNASGVATTTTTFTAAGATPIVATFTPTSPTAFNPSASAAFTENVSATNPLAVPEILTVTVPIQGSFSFGTSDGVAPPTVPLTVNASTTTLTATGTIDAVKVVDTRTGTGSFNGFPGWSVIGQATDFTNPSSNPVGDIPATDLAWAPVAANGDYTRVGTPRASPPPQVLGNALAGHGQETSILGAGLTLTMPASAPAGAYSSTLTLTANPDANTP